MYWQFWVKVVISQQDSLYILQLQRQQIVYPKAVWQSYNVIVLTTLYQIDHKNMMI